MPSIEIDAPNIEDLKIDEAPAIKSTVGIIYPPPEVRNIVDKTASFVARNGPEFENRIRQNEVNNPKFNFLQPTDAYHGYYQYKVSEFKEGKAQEPQAPKLTSLYLGVRPTETQKIVETFVPKDPPPEFEFMCDPPSISAYDLDVVKLTAQFVARNGRQFLTTVMQKEQRNYLFDFLRPQHSLFTYFTKLVEQYTKILIPPKNLKEKLNKEVNHPREILDQVKYRVDWAKHQDREKKKEEEALEKERVAYAQIDWHDFVVVETVDFQPTEIGNLPPPTTPEEVGARILQMERFVRGEIPIDDAVEMEVESEGEDDEESDEDDREIARAARPMTDGVSQDMEESEEDSEEEDETPRGRLAPPPPPPPPPPKEAPPPPLPPAPERVVIKKDYNPKAKPAPPAEPSPDQFMISPITGEKIPAHKVQEHMRIGLLDPKWMEDRQRSLADKSDQEEVFAPGSAIDSNLKLLAERRTDIFGIGTEETQIGKKIGEEEKKETKVVWDGHTASMEKVSQLARENISIEEQIATIHRAKGLVHDEEKEKIGPAVPKVAPPLPPPPPSAGTNAPPPPPVAAIVPPPPPAPPQQLRPAMPPMAHPMIAGPPIGMPPMMVVPPRPPMMMGMARPPMMAPMGMAMPPSAPMMAPAIPIRPPGIGGAPVPTEEPPSKKQKTEENLIPEDVFLQTHKGNVKVQVMVPNIADKPELNLKGQKLEFTLPITDSVSVLKVKLHETLGLAAGKQKLQYEGMFIKDSNSLAFYNFLNGATVQLQLKERGGRKK
ncbi:splicing factor 3A subunit 1-like [Biomphalaria glabrata]|uniref:Splicing factor 3A subunit 1 n=1 Tax=Biomphalaria glabrata TaxID=6526 RepID=A0A9W2Z0E7_BIOGL|nr:splicing factor 3A subunit 1-like [Biomphalaria glabrata]